MNEKTENKEKISFKAYYESITTDERNSLRDSMYLVGMANSTFYYKVREDKFTELELRELESLTSQTFDR